VTDLPPSVMKLLDPAPLDALRIVFVGGEAFSHELVRAWGKGRRIFNGYGVTECTVTTSWKSSKEPLPPGALSMGGPMDNHTAYRAGRSPSAGAPGRNRTAGAGRGRVDVGLTGAATRTTGRSSSRIRSAPIRRHAST